MPAGRLEISVDALPISFVVCVNDDAILNANLLASPCLGKDSPHEVIALHGASSAAAGLNTGLDRAKHELVVCLHQDVYLPQGWDEALVSQYRLAEKKLGPIGVAGVYGVGGVNKSPTGTLGAERIGWVRDRGRLLHEGGDFPTPVVTLDELLLVLPRGTPLRFDPSLGFHLYGADICLQAREQGLSVAVLGALCHHNSRSIGLPAAFFPSADIFARKWAHRLPVAAPCVVFDQAGKTFKLGNTPAGAASAPAEEEVTAQMAEKPGDVTSSISVGWDQASFQRKLAERPDDPLIIDAFTYWNEAEMLAFRLRILSPLVDKFVIVESDRTFAGHEKAYYSEQFDFTPWKDKIIIHRVKADVAGLKLAERPEGYDPRHDCWKIEYQQRNAIIDACRGFADTDFIMISDVDEIPSREAVAKLIAEKFCGIVTMQHSFFYYNLSRLRIDASWRGTIWAPLAAARKIGAQGLRDARGSTGFHVDRAGWHLSYFGDIGDIKNKIQNFSHQEYNKPEFINETRLAERVKNGHSPFDDNMRSVNPPPGFFPEYFREAVTQKKWWGREARLTSIIIPCWNQLEYSRICIDALFQHTGSAWELIVIDNGSTDGTGDYLASIRETCPVTVTVIANKENLGFSAAINQGLQVATGDYMLLLNNDAVVTDGWLDRLIALAEMKLDGNQAPTGMVGPMSNYVTPPQAIETVPYHDLEGMHGFARQWGEQHRGRWVTSSKLSGFCLLMKRAVYDAVGGMDERFGLGFFDDDDLALRVRKAGFGLVVAQDVFVHHFGNRTMVGNGVDAEALMQENMAKFLHKWGQEVQVQRGEKSYRSTGQQGTPLVANADTDRTAGSSRKAKVSLTMIVRNEEQNLPRCLESVRGVFDEIVVVDTGSTDRTKEIAAGFGARVVDFAWIDDFAAARNVALANATGDYALWLDADDVIEPQERDKLAKLLEKLRPKKKEAYVLRCFCDTADGGQIAVDHVRLFPLLPGIRWERRIHEVINAAVDRAGIPTIWTDIIIRHRGYTNAEVHERKRQRNLILLHKEMAERPDDPFIYYYIGTAAFEEKRWQEALGYFIISLAKWGTTDSIACKLFAMISWSNELLKRYDEALRVADEGLHYFRDDGELLFRKALIHRFRGEIGDAEAAFTKILSLDRPKKLYNVEPGIFGHMTRGNLALIAEERGDDALALVHWRAVIAERPGDAHAMPRIEALAAEERGDYTLARACWQEVLAVCPGDPNALCRLRKINGTMQPALAVSVGKILEVNSAIPERGR